MSTRLLTTPGKVHELCDDLESLWFVLLFESLHFVKHNEPADIRMDQLFDQSHVNPKTGAHTGGLGKHFMYISRGLSELEFASKPLTILVQQIFSLFRSLIMYHTDEEARVTPSDSVKNDVGKLQSCEEIERLFDEALDSGEWVKGDKVGDQYPRLGRHLTPAQKDAVGSSYAICEVSPPSTPSGRKRKREEEAEEEEEEEEGEEEEGCPPVSNEVKRPRVGLPFWRLVWDFLAN